MHRLVVSLGSLALLLAIGGCSGSPLPSLGGDAAGVGANGMSLASITTYGGANAFLTTGYSDREIAADHFEVRVKGSTVTPPARLEKIALARAAEIAADRKFKYFKTGPFAHGVSCKDAKDAAHKGGKVAAERAPVVAVDVVYANEALDAGYMPGAETFARLSGELATESVSAEAKVAAATDVQAKCGK